MTYGKTVERCDTGKGGKSEPLKVPPAKNPYGGGPGTGISPVKEFSVPQLINLNLDPREEHALVYGGEHGWIRFPMGKIMTDYLESLKKYPPIPPGAPDPYVPHAAK